jgi:hypothetical protein
VSYFFGKSACAISATHPARGHEFSTFGCPLHAWYLSPSNIIRSLGGGKKKLLKFYRSTRRNRGSSVNTVTRLWAGQLGFKSQQGQEISCRPDLGSTQPPIRWVSGALSLGVKRPRREADHSPPSNAEVKNMWSYTSSPLYIFMAWYLVKHRDKFTS